MGRGHEKLVLGPNSLCHQSFSPRIRRTPDKRYTRRSATDARHLLGVWSAIRKLCRTCSKTGSITSEQGTAGRCPLLGNNPETGKQHPLGGISSWLTSRGVDNREAQFRIAFGMVSGLVSEKAVHGENLFQTFAAMETIAVTLDSGLPVTR